jgi:hypothetical protein
MDDKQKNARSESRLSAAWREWIAPVAVAGAFALAVAGSVDLVHRTEQQKPPATQTTKRTVLAAQKRSAPGFVVAVRRSGTAVVVRDVASGRIVDETMPPPAGQRYHQVAAAPDGTYVVSSFGAGRVAFHRLRLSDRGRATAFTPLPRALTGVSTAWSDMAVSSDGGRIGYVTYQGPTPRVDVLSLATGAHRGWTTTLKGRIGGLSWSGDTLSYVWAPLPASGGKRAAGQVRSLDTARTGGDLRSSRAVLTLPPGGEAAVMSRDAKTVMTGVSDRSGITITAIPTASAPQGKAQSTPQSTPQSTMVRRLAGPRGLAGLVLDSTGRYLLAVTDDGGLYAGSAREVPKIAGSGFTDVAW